MPPSPSPPPTWILTDGHAGNLRQATALARALGLERPQARQVAVPAPWRWFAPRRLPGAARTALPRPQASTPPPALAIGCGRQAALATRLLRRRGVPVVQILDPRIHPRHWDLVIAPEHDGLRGENVITLLGSLNPVDASWLADARAAFPALAAAPRPRTTLLLGGDTRRGRFGLADFEALATRLDAALRDGGSLLATASRRTPDAIRDALKRRYADAPGLVWRDPADGPNPYPGLLAWADRIICTADSANMVSEACATTVPVYVAGADAAQGKLAGFLRALEARGRIRPLDGALSAYPVEPLRETARVAEQVRDRMGLGGARTRGLDSLP